MANLQATEPYFVRCVNPNKKKSNTIFSRKVVEHQLRCGGIIEALRVLSLGYPTRVSYEILYQKYHPNIENPLIKRMGPDRFAAAILVAFGVGEEFYELGLTKIFFKPKKAAILDEIMAQADDLTDEQNERVLNWLAERRKLQLFGMLKISSYYNNKVRDARALARWEFSGQTAGCVAFSLLRYLQAARENIEERNRNRAATVIASYWRAYYVQERLNHKKKKVKKAVRKLWRAHLHYSNKQAMITWLTEAVEETRQRKEREEKERKERERREREEKARIAKEMADAEEERLRQMKAEQREEELKRLEEERQRKAEEAEKARQEAARIAAEEEKKKKEAEAARLEAEKKKKEERRLAVKEEALKQREKSVRVNQQLAKENKEAAKKRRQKKQAQIDAKIDDQYDDEEEKRLQIREENLRNIHVNNHVYPEDMSSSDNEEYDDIFGSQKPQDFRRVAANGTLFMKHTGRKKNRAPQDRFVKVTFSDQTGKPTRISWGSGSRHLDFKEIRLIAWGHYSPAFVVRSEELDPRTCFSIVSQHSILDLQNADVRVVEQWVRGLRELIQQTDEDANQLSRELRDNPPRQRRPHDHALERRKRQSRRGDDPDRERAVAKRDERTSDRPRRRRKSRRVGPKKHNEEHKKRTKSLMLLQQDLFVMTTTTVFRNLEEDDYPITQRLKDSFNPKEMYEKALANDVPWRQWQNWIHEQIIQKMIDSGTIPPPNQGSIGTGRMKPGQGAPGVGAEGTNPAIEDTPGGRERRETNADCIIS